MWPWTVRSSSFLHQALSQKTSLSCGLCWMGWCQTRHIKRSSGRPLQRCTSCMHRRRPTSRAALNSGSTCCTCAWSQTGWLTARGGAACTTASCATTATTTQTPSTHTCGWSTSRRPCRCTWRRTGLTWTTAGRRRSWGGCGWRATRWSRRATWPPGWACRARARWRASWARWWTTRWRWPATGSLATACPPSALWPSLRGGTGGSGRRTTMAATCPSP
mmetsp:Transcript_21272/g.54096  ORF Transcript_21272/g.54096 Transcript_21272/m.54096 type:complete len:219 (+) Transcript_21272:661-1317(+)